MGFFSFFKKKKKETAQPTKQLTPSSKISGNEELAVPEYDNAFSFEKPLNKNAAEPAPVSKAKEKKPRATSEKAKSAAPQKETAVKAPKQDDVIDKREPAPDGNGTDVDTASGRTGRFEIKKTKDDRYVFNLYASNHVIVATSQVYSSPQSAITGIKSVIANASKAGIEDQTLKNYTTLPYPKWEIYVDNGNQYRFRLSASNGSCVCHSQGYTKKANCKSGIESIQKFAPTARIDKAYIKKPTDT